MTIFTPPEHGTAPPRHGADASFAQPPITLEQALDACERGTAVVTVNQRLARSLNEAYEHRRVERGALWWETPAILPLSGWLTALHDEALTLGLSDRARVPALVAERHWRRIVEQDRTLPALLSPGATARRARHAWQLAHTWDCLPDGDDYLSSDQRHWRDWAERYAALLEEEGLIDEAALAAHLEGAIASGALALPPGVVCAGFLQPTPRLARLLDALARAGVPVSVLADGPPAEPRCLRFADDAAELRAVADAAYRALRDASEDEPGSEFESGSRGGPRVGRQPRLGVVVPDLEQRRDRVLRAFDRRFFPAMTPDEIDRAGRPYDVSIGRPLAACAPVRSALLALELAHRGLESAGVSALLLSPYLGHAGAECRDRERLDRRLRDRRVQHLDLPGFVAALDRKSELRVPLARFAHARAGRRSGERSGAPAREGSAKATIGEWAARFGDVLRAFGWPGEDLASDEYQCVQAWHAVLDDLLTLDDGERLGAGDALALVRRLAAERTFQVDVPARPIRLLGRLESHGQRFDRLWVIGMDAERWPPGGSPDPFLPIARQKAAGLPEAAGATRLALALKEFEHWRRAAPHVTVSCAAERDGKALECAAVVLEPTDARPEDPDIVGMIAAVAALESIDDASAPGLAEGSEVRGGARLFEDQALCPFRAFVAHRLGVRALEEVPQGLDARQQGTLLHKVLECFWEALGDHAALAALAARGPDALDAEIARAVDAALVAEQIDVRLHRIERRRLGELVREWVERCELPRTAFEVAGFEQALEIERGGLKLEVKVDRIDRVDGGLIVLDYKSGIRNRTDSWSEARITQPQLPLYALTDPAIAGVAFAEVAPRACRYRGVADDPEVLPGIGIGGGDFDGGWRGWRAHWARSLDAVAAELKAGHAAITPLETACEHCGMKPICRIDSATLEVRSASAGPGVEDED